MREWIGRCFSGAYATIMDIDFGWSEEDVVRVQRALGLALIVRLVLIPLVKWTVILLVIPVLTLIVINFAF